MAKKHRRGHGEGTINKRSDGRWEAQYTDPDGKRHSIYAATRPEVRDKLAAVQQQIADGVLVADGRQPTGVYLVKWLTSIEATVKPTTFQNYVNYVRLYTEPLHAIALADIRPHHIEALYVAMKKKGLSSRTIHHVHMTLHRAFAVAMQRAYVSFNVMDRVFAPHVEDPEMLHWEAYEARLFLHAAKGTPHEALFVLALTTGMRRGELLGLQWTDIDFSKKTLTVNHTLSHVRGVYQLTTPKTEKGKRKIVLSQRAVLALQEHRQKQDILKQQYRDLYHHDLNLVFCRPDGWYLHSEVLYHQHFEKIMNAAGVPPIRFHDMRHTAATLLIESGMDLKTTSGTLGHASVATTADMYVHFTDAMSQAAADIADTIFAFDDQEKSDV